MNALVLLPGMEGSGDLFAQFAAEMRKLAPALQLIIVRYPPDRALGYAELVEYARMQLPQQGSYLVLGESFSGPIAIRLAASAPPGLRGLILCGTFLRNPARTLSPLRLLPASLLSHVMRLLPRQPPAAMLRRYLLDHTHEAALAPAIRTALGLLAPGVFAARLIAVLRHDVSAEFAAVRVPILYLRALRDRLVGYRIAEHMRRLQPAMRIDDFDTPHLLLQTEPRKSARQVHAFICGLEGVPE